MRPTFRKFSMPAMPATMVKKITSEITILTSLMKASPSGFISTARPGDRYPSPAPAAIANSTWT